MKDTCCIAKWSREGVGNEEELNAATEAEEGGAGVYAAAGGILNAEQSLVCLASLCFTLYLPPHFVQKKGLAK